MRLLCRRYGPCEPESLKERMKRAVALLGPAEVADIMQKEGKIEVSDLSETFTCVGALL